MSTNHPFFPLAIMLKFRYDGRYMSGKRVDRAGFALPTVLIASFVMLLVLSSVLSSVSSGAIVTLDSTHYDRYTKNAAESGLAMANACLQLNDYAVTWSNANPLQPNTDCTGTVDGGADEYVYDNDNVRSSFTVPEPTTLATGVIRVSVTANVERLRASTGTPWRIYSINSFTTFDSQAGVQSVQFGYQSGGVFFSTLNDIGNPVGVGLNTSGQLGNASTSNTTTPVGFILPTGPRVSQIYTNFSGYGKTVMTALDNGTLYGAGDNTYGQLGNGSTSATQSTPVQFQLPGGVRPVFVLSQDATFVLGDDHNIYAAGACTYGILGYNYTISGCSNQSTYQRVNLPTVSTGNLNTLPVESSASSTKTTNFVANRSTAHVIMQGGYVYGWGRNDFGQVGNNSTTDRSNPARVTTLGNGGQPTATQLSSDGKSVLVRASDGSVYAWGNNDYGQLGSRSSIRAFSGDCIDVPSSSTTPGTQIQIYDCNDTNAQIYIWAQDGSLQVYPNGSTLMCIENSGGVTTNGNPIVIATCDSTAKQQWQLRDDQTIYNPASGKCILNPGNTATNGTLQQLNTCDTSNAQKWTNYRLRTPHLVNLPTGHGTVTKVSQGGQTSLFLMSDGTVFGAGYNGQGSLGTGTTKVYNPRLTQMTLPVGRTAVDIYTESYGTVGGSPFYTNSFVILDDGTVYGAGQNDVGQLGNSTTAAFSSSLQQFIMPSGAGTAVSVQTGFRTTIVIDSRNQVYTVGFNGNGQLGDGTTSNSSTPARNQYTNLRPAAQYVY